MGDRSGLLGGDEGNWWQRRTKKEKGIVVGGVATFLAIIILVIVLTTTRKPTPATPTESPTEGPTTPTISPTEPPTGSTEIPSEPTTASEEPSTSPPEPTTTVEPTTVTTPTTEAPTTATEPATTESTTTEVPTEPTTEATSASTESSTTEATEATTVPEPTEPTEPTEPPTSTTTETPEGGICETDACVREAAAISANLNREVNPCDDFYAFACGKWSEHHELPATEGRISNFNLISKIVSKRLSDIFLEHPEKEAASLAFLRKTFRACNDTKGLNEDGIDPLKKLTTDAMDHGWKTGLQRAIGIHGLNAVASVTVQPNPNNSTQFVVTLDQPSFGVGRTELVNTDEKALTVKKAYTELLAKNAALFLNKENAEKIASDVVDLETQLAAAAAPASERRDVVKMTKTVLASEFKRMTPAFDWIEFVNSVLFQAENFVIKLEGDDIIVVNDLEYFKKISEIVADESHTETLGHYVALRVVQEFGFLSTDEVRQNGFELDKVVEGISKPHNHQDVLTDRLVSDVPSLMGRLYVDRHFSQDEQTSAESIIRKILDQYKVMLQSSKWLGDKSRPEALEKIDNMQLNVGYANWIKNDEELDTRFPYDPKDKEKGLELFLELRRIQMKSHFNRFKQQVNKDYEWPMSPALVNAAYEPSQNSITFPAAILQGVFFDQQRPAQLNYGAIGQVIGHEISHGFDDQGAKYDHEGNLHNWWSETAEKKFNSRAKCFVDQYSAVFVPEVKMHLDGRNTQGENIADNGGIHQAYEALDSLMSQGQKLPRLKDLEYTPEQLFFLSNGNVWCGLIRDEALRQQIQYDPHSPAKYRINVPLSNSQRFADAFQCKPGSAMNPEKKCELW